MTHANVRVSIQTDLGKLEDYVNSNIVKFHNEYMRMAWDIEEVIIPFCLAVVGLPMACWSSFGSPVETEHLRCWSRSNRGLMVFRSIEHMMLQGVEERAGLF